MNDVLTTHRLRLVPASPEMLAAAIEGPAALARLLRVDVPATWPPLYVDDDALRYTARRLAEGEGQAGWWMYFVILTHPAGSETLIGTVGYKGPPTAEGVVEVGYGIVSDQHRRGLATEATRALIARAFAVPEVREVIAETLPELIASIGVMTKCGFEYAGSGSESGVIRYHLTRERWNTLPHSMKSLSLIA
jgi:ribosomal-protein-alanine N-acetyltransferase